MSDRPEPAVDTLSALFEAFRLRARIFHNAQYCGSDWAVDTSGTGLASFHMVTHGACRVISPALAAPEPLEAGDIVIFPRDASHQLHTGARCPEQVNAVSAISFEQGPRADGVGLLCGHFLLKHNAGNPLLAMLPPVVIWRCGSDPSARALSDLIRMEALADRAGSEAMLNRLAETLFVALAREHSWVDHPLANLVTALADKRLRRVLDLIHSKPGHRWTLAQFAEAASMSRSAFAEHFKRTLGESPMHYLARWRMQQASIWLAEEGASIIEVASHCGYDTEASFSKAFKKITGTSPGSLRKAHA